MAEYDPWFTSEDETRLGAIHDRLAAEQKLEAANDSGDPARITAAQANHAEAVAAHEWNPEAG